MLAVGSQVGESLHFFFFCEVRNLTECKSDIAEAPSVLVFCTVWHSRWCEISS